MLDRQSLAENMSLVSLPVVAQALILSRRRLQVWIFTLSLVEKKRLY